MFKERQGNERTSVVARHICFLVKVSADLTKTLRFVGIATERENVTTYHGFADFLKLELRIQCLERIGVKKEETMSSKNKPKASSAIDAANELSSPLDFSFKALERVQGL